MLHGLCPADWRRVRQVAMEVHDVYGRLDAAVALLAADDAGDDAFIGDVRTLFSCGLPELVPAGRATDERHRHCL